ncbi:hypothetical protein D9758_014114 [Tetrapyrgos nigripes]|uniref:NAD(P)-binding protein n=1 Tax=Tetrapyrgos nigripes TaxID=182062 RepID=A0A8H5FJG3_9AGAR|nr:hypothetical protein D9758_014114 [Tetrapyrgos nigripes]
MPDSDPVVDLSDQRAVNLFDLQGVVAVVTGGGSGIGLMISSTLIANGATVYIIGPKQEDLDRITRIYNNACEKTVGEGGGKMIGLEGDVSVKDEAVRLANEISKRSPYVTVLFNNAGITGANLKLPSSTSESPSSSNNPSNSTSESTPSLAESYRTAVFSQIHQEDFLTILKTNAIGPFYLTFSFLPLLEKWKNSTDEVTRKFVPQIIMTSSMNGWTKDSVTGGKSFPYLFSKSALGHATASLAHELLPLGIRVNGIAPGLFPTEMPLPGHSNSAGITQVPPSYLSSLQFHSPAGLGTKKDIGTLALFLVANWFVNGETVLIDGGVNSPQASIVILNLKLLRDSGLDYNS